MKLYVAMLVAAFLVFSGTAFAKTVSGKYAGTQNEGKSIWVSTQDEATGAESKAEIWVSADTKWEGVNALSEVKDGQNVTVEADQDEAGNWKASSVKVAATPATA